VSNRLVELFLYDTVIAATKIRHVASSYHSADALRHDFMAWDTVIREFMIIGEATRQLFAHNRIVGHLRPVVDFRNVLVHEYFGIDEEEVWDVIHNGLPDFCTIILEAISKTDSETNRMILQALREEYAHLDFILNRLDEIEK
jgi:uncharacterized protein with HEPN domain